jgi:hypothetical protein
LRSRRSIRRAVNDLVEDLGASHNAIADSLARHGVRGVPGSHEQCALARYLRAVVSADPETVTVSVPGPTVHVQLSKGRPSIRVRLSSEVRAFVQAFDAGLFPDLVEHPGPRSTQQSTLEPST